MHMTAQRCHHPPPFSLLSPSLPLSFLYSSSPSLSFLHISIHPLLPLSLPPSSLPLPPFSLLPSYPCLHLPLATLLKTLTVVWLTSHSPPLMVHSQFHLICPLERLLSVLSWTTNLSPGHIHSYIYVSAFVCTKAIYYLALLKLGVGMNHS